MHPSGSFHLASSVCTRGDYTTTTAATTTPTVISPTPSPLYPSNYNYGHLSYAVASLLTLSLYRLYHHSPPPHCIFLSSLHLLLLLTGSHWTLNCSTSTKLYYYCSRAAAQQLSPRLCTVCVPTRRKVCVHFQLRFSIFISVVYYAVIDSNCLKISLSNVYPDLK